MRKKFQTKRRMLLFQKNISIPKKHKLIFRHYFIFSGKIIFKFYPKNFKDHKKENRPRKKEEKGRKKKNKVRRLLIIQIKKKFKSFIKIYYKDILKYLKIKINQALIRHRRSRQLCRPHRRRPLASASFRRPW